MHKLVVNNSRVKYTKNPKWYNDDYWNFADLGLAFCSDDGNSIFSFNSIKQPWFKNVIKNIIFTCSYGKSVAYVRSMVSSMGTFSKYLETAPHITSLRKIKRDTVLDYYKYLYNLNVSASTVKIRIIYLSKLFDICYEQGLMSLKDKLIQDNDYPNDNKKIPRFISDNVLNQLNAVLDQLDPNVYHIMRILQETGMRINEVFILKFDCIYQDQASDYFLKYHLLKINKEHVIPISKDLAELIIKQKSITSAEWGEHELLFPIPRYVKSSTDDSIRKTRRPGLPWRRKSLIKYIDRFIEKHNIVDDNGKLWHVKFHDFRHTVATKMINSDVPQHIVQRFLGHESPTMTARYAHILDQTLKDAFANFQGKNVSITGDVVQSKDIAMQLMDGTDPEQIDAMWLKKNIMAQALPNGTCALPVISKSCPHANACLTCVNFRTDHRFISTHKQQLSKTEAIIQQAKENGWQRQIEMNEIIKVNLEKIIKSLETAA